MSKPEITSQQRFQCYNKAFLDSPMEKVPISIVAHSWDNKVQNTYTLKLGDNSQLSKNKDAPAYYSFYLKNYAEAEFEPLGVGTALSNSTFSTNPQEKIKQIKASKDILNRFKEYLTLGQCKEIPVNTPPTMTEPRVNFKR